MTALELFELEWLGGVAERSFRRVRPDVEAFPWGTLASVAVAAEVRDRARHLWTQAALSEYRAALGFADVLHAMLAARAPLDLVGMAGGFVADEVSHVEMCSRVAMELGGGAPIAIDWTVLGRAHVSGDAFAYANDRVLLNVCVSEVVSGAVAVDTARMLAEPLPLAVLTTIARDEARHSRVGWLYMDWAVPRMTDGERERLGNVLARGLGAFAPLLRAGPRRSLPELSQKELLRLGWLDRGPYAGSARQAVLHGVVEPLSRRGIQLSAAARDELFGASNDALK